MRSKLGIERSSNSPTAPPAPLPDEFADPDRDETVVDDDMTGANQTTIDRNVNGVGWRTIQLDNLTGRPSRHLLHRCRAATGNSRQPERELTEGQQLPTCRGQRGVGNLRI